MIPRLTIAALSFAAGFGAAWMWTAEPLPEPAPAGVSVIFNIRAPVPIGITERARIAKYEAQFEQRYPIDPIDTWWLHGHAMPRD
jgi:hypothetical protein